MLLDAVYDASPASSLRETVAILISIVMPALDEARHIEAAIASITPHGPNLEYEILVLDGGSTDATSAIVSTLARQDPRIRLISNPGRTQAAAMNLAARVADPRSTILLRADCHAEYPPGFALACVRAMDDRGCKSVVVPMLTIGVSCMQRAIAAAQNSRLGNGGSAHRIAGSSGYVEHGHHAAFDRATFLALGGYREDMPANEDAEFDQRLTAAGHRIWLCGEATIRYFPRSTLAALSRQYRAYGWGRATTAIKHRTMPRPRQLLPLVALLGCTVSLTLAVLDARIAAGAALYVSLCLGWGLALALQEKRACVLLSGLAAMTMHLSWAVGFLMRLLRHDWRSRSSKLKS